MAEVGNVTALLKLDTSGFDNGIANSIGKVESFVKTMEKLGTTSTKFSDGFREIQTELNKLDTAINQLTTDAKQFESFNKLANGMNALVKAAQAFNKEGGVTVTTFTQMGNGIRAFMNAIGGVDVKLTNVVQAEERVVTSTKQLELALARVGANFGNGYQNYISQINQVQSALKNLGNGYGNYLSNINQVQSALNQTTTATNNTSNATKTMTSNMNSASNSTSTARQRFSGLTQTLGGLRTMLSMVGSMFLFNFAHNLMISVSNTVKAKSEMQSFLHTMGMTGGQIDSFNAALDRTAERFQRINKYNIGETVANIGLEFDLSAQEMEKAMSVTSMVTSEYLRAGRNADEAALAVKDIMQGQFQRLSRETGVKGEQLKEAGWSGDVNDVMGLMDALEKVAKSRHWDTFAEKASSLNDIVLITQNRLSEWATDMSEGVVPLITGSFNALLNIVDKVTAFFSGMGEALNLPDWTGTALLVTGFGVAIAGLLTQAIRLRTGMGLLQIAQNGLRQSIVATIFSIKQEEMATARATTVAKARILGVQTETMAQMGVINILKAKVLGLDAETVAQEGLTGAIAKKIYAQKLEGVQNSLNTSKNVTLLNSYIALKSGISVADAASLKWYQKLAVLNKEITVTQARTMGFGKSLKAFISSLNASRIATTLLRTAIVGLAAVLIIQFAMAVQKSAQTMKNFNDLVENGDDKIRKVKEQFGETSEEAKKMTEAVERARSAMSKFEKRKEVATDRANRTVAKYLEDAGIDQEKIREITNQALRDANAGVSIVARTGDEIEKTYRGAANSIGLMKDKLKGDEYSKYAEDMLTSADRIAVAQEKMMMSDSAMDRFFGWIDFTVEQLGHWWTEFSTNLAHQDWGAAWTHIWRGFMRGFGQLSIASDIWGAVYKALGFEAYKGTGWAGVKDIANEWKGKGWELIGFKNTADAVKNLFSTGDFDIGTTLGSIGDIIRAYFKDYLSSGSWGWDPVKDMYKFIYDTFHNFSWKNIGEIIRNYLVGGESWGFDPVRELYKWIETSFKDFGKMMDGIVSLIKLPNFGEMIWKALFGDNGGSGGGGILKKIDPTFITDSLNGVIQSIGEWWSAIDWSAILGQGGGIFNKLLGLDENTDIGAMLGQKLAFAQEYINGFVTYVSSYFANLPASILTYLSQIGTNILTQGGLWVQYGVEKASNLVTSVVSFISQLPSRVYTYIVQTGSNILSGAISWVSNARNKATETVNAVRDKVAELPQEVYNEFVKIGDRIRQAIDGAVRAALQFGTDVKNAVLNALGIHSPGFVQEALAKEFGDIGGRIAENTSTVQSEASDFGQAIVTGMDSQMGNVVASATALTDAMSQTQPDVVLDGSFVGDYRADANVISGINQTISTDTTTTFDTLGATVNSTISGMSTNLQTSYTGMATTQTTSLNNMQNQNRTAFNNIQNQTNTSLNNMRSSTQNVTLQMTNAWMVMKDNIVSAANQLQTRSTAHFNTLSGHIGTFYRKLQNPSMWGGGDYKMSASHYSPHRGLRGANEVRRAFGIPTSGGRVSGGRYAGGPSLSSIPERMTLKELKNLVGGGSVFNGLDMSQEVNVIDFLNANGLALGWGDWHNPHFNRIKSTSGEWNMEGPSIMHRIPTGQTFKVKEFYNSQPQISFSSFQRMAEALFSAIPYEYYFNSDAHGSWVGALEAGSCNCYDGANALVALAATCGFSGHTQGGTWNGIPHVYAVINGKKMDTTGWQQRRDWNGVAAGSPSSMKGFGNTTEIKVTVDMTNSNIYGIDDLNSHIEEGVNRVMEEKINPSNIIGV